MVSDALHWTKINDSIFLMPRRQWWAIIFMVTEGRQESWSTDCKDFLPQNEIYRTQTAKKDFIHSKRENAETESTEMNWNLPALPEHESFVRVCVCMIKGCQVWIRLWRGRSAGNRMQWEQTCFPKAYHVLPDVFVEANEEIALIKFRRQTWRLEKLFLSGSWTLLLRRSLNCGKPELLQVEWCSQSDGRKNLWCHLIHFWGGCFICSMSDASSTNLLVLSKTFMSDAESRDHGLAAKIRE